MTTWLAFDIGTTGAKAALIRVHGDELNILRTAHHEYPTTADDGGIIEQSARDWWAAACAAARDLEPLEADAIALTGQMQDLILLDAEGEPIRPAILYSDTRAYTEAEWINARLGRERLAHLTGYDQEAGGLLAKLRWLIAHDPTALNNAAHLLVGAADVIANRLTDQFVTDITTAGTTGLLSLETRTWLKAEILDQIGLAYLTRLLPDLVPGGTQIGGVGEMAALAMGIRAGIPVHLGPGDAGAATLGIGAGTPGAPYAYIGTSGWVGYTSSERGDPAQGVWTLAHPDPALMICVAPLLTAGGNLDWARQAFGYADHDEMIEAALTAEPTSLIYLPYLNGERSPIKDPFARGAFIGLSERHTAADMARAVLEGVVFAYRHGLDALVREPVTMLTVTGGGTRSEGLVGLIADVTGLPVRIPEDATNTGLRGAVLAARVARGERATWRVADAAVAAAFAPNESKRDPYARKYAWFREAYPALQGLFRKMA
ncbi:MAG: hypothetical protein JNL42_16550 [Anaerolineae bacterium]|nr:hypothetical protein [Anaerolineae bacterium]